MSDGMHADGDWIGLKVSVELPYIGCHMVRGWRSMCVEDPPMCMRLELHVHAESCLRCFHDVSPSLLSPIEL